MKKMDSGEITCYLLTLQLVKAGYQITYDEVIEQVGIKQFLSVPKEDRNRYLQGKLSVDKLGIHKEYRRKGLGRAFLNELLKYNLPIKLDVASKNEDAIRFYEGFGFRKVGEKQLGKNHISVYEFRN